MIKYNELFAQLAIKGMKKTDLLEVISAPTLAKLSKGEVVKTDVIDRLCLFLECQPEQIMHVESEEIQIDNNTGEPLTVKYRPEFDFSTGKSNNEIIDVIPISTRKGN